jgi:hypothetical protein
MRNPVFLLMFGAVSLLAGCATHLPNGGQFPVNVGPNAISVRIQGYTKDGLELPLGAYRVRGTSYVILSQVHGSVPGEGALGALGLLGAHSARQEKGKTATEQLYSAFNFNLDLETKNTFKKELGDGGKFQLVDVPIQGSERLDVTPYVWVGTYSNGQSRVHVILLAELKDQMGETKWWNQYIYYSTQTRSLTGDSGWIANDGASIKSATQQGIGFATAILLDDVRGSRKRVGERARYTAPIMSNPGPITLEGTLLSQDKNVALLEIGWSGLHIMPASEISIATNK